MSLLTLERVMPLARSLATREAHREADADDLMQVGLFEYHRTIQRCSATDVAHPTAFARTVLLRAMRTYYHQQREWQRRGEPNLHTALDALDRPSATDLPDASYSTQAALFSVHSFFDALEQQCGGAARLVAENLFEPRGKCAEFIVHEARGKATAQKGYQPGATRHQPRGAKKRVRFSARSVREGLGMSVSEFARQLTIVRAFTQQYFELPVS